MTEDDSGESDGKAGGHIRKRGLDGDGQGAGCAGEGELVATDRGRVRPGLAVDIGGRTEKRAAGSDAGRAGLEMA